MKKETVITAIVFFGVGFLAGYIYDAQKKLSSPQGVTRAGDSQSPPQGTSSPNSAPSDSGSRATAPGLPEGHPPIDSTLVIKDLEDQASRNPKDSEPLLKLANFLYDQKQYERAIEWYQRALELDSTNVSARTDLGTAFFYVGRPRDALREYRKSLEVNPRHEPTLFNMIVVNLEGTHDLAGAREAWERLHGLNPNYSGLDRMKERLDAARASGAGVER